MTPFECVSTLKNARVVAQKEGALLGSVSHIYFDQEQRRLSALTFKPRRLFGDASFVAMQDVVSMGRDVVFIPEESKSQQVSPTAKPRGREIESLFGHWVTTTEGKHLGHLSDVDFDPVTWDVSALRLSEGTRIPVKKENVVFGADEVMVDATVADEFVTEPQKQGVLAKFLPRHVVNQLGETLQDTVLGRRRTRRHAEMAPNSAERA